MKSHFAFIFLVLVILAVKACAQGEGSGPLSPPAATESQPTAQQSAGNSQEASGVAPSSTPSTQSPSTNPASTAPAFDAQWNEILANVLDKRGPAKAIALMTSLDGYLPDRLVRSFLDYHRELCFYMETAALADQDEPVLPETAAKALGLTMEEYRANCYDFWTSEAYLYFTPDLPSLYQDLSGQLSQESAAYFQLLLEYPPTALVADAFLQVSWGKLADFVANYYIYLSAWPYGVHSDEVMSHFAWAYQIYIGAIRLDNSPFDAGGNLDASLRQSYEDFLEAYGESFPPAEDIRLLYQMWTHKNGKADSEIYALIHMLAEQYPFIT